MFYAYEKPGILIHALSLQGILVENMRREGFELGVCPPKVLFKKDENGGRLEPIEEVVVEVCSPSPDALPT